MRVLGTVGLPGSGKSEAATVAREADVPVVTMGDVIRDACRARGLDPTTHHGEVARKLREEEGETAVVDRTIDRLREVEAALALVDGLRSPAELGRFRESFGGRFLLVSVEAPFELRADRAADRERDASDDDRDSFRERETREKGFGVDEVMAEADVRLDNTGSLAAFHDRIGSLLAVGRDDDGAWPDELPVGDGDGERIHGGPDDGPDPAADRERGSTTDREEGDSAASRTTTGGEP